MEAWQKKCVFWRTFRQPGRLTMLITGLALSLVFSLILDWFWPAVALLSLTVIGFVVSLAVDLGRPANINRRIYQELIAEGGLGYRFKSRLEALRRLFGDFLRQTRGLDDAVIGEARREAMRGSLLLADRLRRVAVLDRLNRDSRRSRIKSDKAEAAVAEAVKEVESFHEHLSRLLVAAADTALLSRELAAEKMAVQAQELRDWREAMREARREMDAGGY